MLARDAYTVEAFTDDRPPHFSDESPRPAVCRAPRTRAALRRGLEPLAELGRRAVALRRYLAAFDLARRVCREAAASCNKKSTAAALAAQNRRRRRAPAKADRRLAATIDQWDADPWPLNTPGGIVDLRTGKMRPARPTTTAPKSRRSRPAVIARHGNRSFSV